MKTSLPIALLTVALALAGGCVSQNHVDELETTNRVLKQQVAELQHRIEELNGRIALLMSSGESRQTEVAALIDERDRLQSEVDRLNGEVASLRDQVTSLRSRRTQVLPPEVEDALKRFAAENAGVASYDPVSGAVKFSSDVTFALGSAEVSDAAKQALNQLAQVLTSNAASGYEVRVVGHTDIVPIRKPGTKRDHPTNWHLSVHRAIAVRDALTAAGVADLRTSVAGYGPYRPVVQNARGGAEPNRRVEVYLVPMAPVNEQLLQPAGGAAPSGSTPANGGASNAGNANTAGPSAIFK